MALLLVATWGCGDGIGRPIVGDGIVAPGAGVGGTTGGSGSGGVMSAGGAGLGGTGAGQTGMSGTGASGAGSGGAFAGGSGSGGMSGSEPRGSGGRERPPPGGGLAPSFEGGYGGLGGEPWMGPPPPGGVPPTPECMPVADWDPAAEGAEWALVECLNLARRFGESCDGAPKGPPIPPVFVRPELTCAARLHSRDMSQKNYFDHVNREGVGPEDRMRQAGAHFRSAGETIGGNPVPVDVAYPCDVLFAIVGAGGSECANLVDSSFDSVGIGVYGGLVTLDFTRF
jgi:hypothetical protein